MENMKKKDNEWIVAVESSLEGKIARPQKSHHGLIHSVPKSLLRKNTCRFYLPQAISFGPYHFRREDVRNHDIELLKSEVARKMHDRTVGNGNSEGLKSVVRKFMENEVRERIKKSYAKEIKLSSEEVLAWMIVRDACFVLEVLDRLGEDEDPENREDEDAEESVTPFIDSVLSRKRHHPLLTEIVKDMLKMENQLPFWVLKTMRLAIEGLNDGVSIESAPKKLSPIEVAEGRAREYHKESTNCVWFESALKNLSPIKVAEGSDRENHKEYHVLQLLHDYIVDSPVANDNNNQHKRMVILFDILDGLIDCLDEYQSDILDKPATKSRRCMKLLFNLLGWVLILLVLSPVLVILFIWGIIFVIWYSIKNYIFAKIEEKAEHVPTVEELKRVGVKFKNLEGDKKIGVSDIKFKDRNSTLYLPKVNIDNRSEVILRNLIALEICSQTEKKPITRYALLMNDLVNTSEDVGILRREGIITSKLGSDDEIAQIWNSMVTATEIPRYVSIDNACEDINQYRKKWWRVLWAQFVMLHCSKPWLFLSLLAGVTLLLLTFVQVICLFESCQLK